MVSFTKRGVEMMKPYVCPVCTQQIKPRIFLNLHMNAKCPYCKSPLHYQFPFAWLTVLAIVVASILRDALLPAVTNYWFELFIFIVLGIILFWVMYIVIIYFHMGKVVIQKQPRTHQ